MGIVASRLADEANAIPSGRVGGVVNVFSEGPSPGVVVVLAWVVVARLEGAVRGELTGVQTECVEREQDAAFLENRRLG